MPGLTKASYLDGQRKFTDFREANRLQREAVKSSSNQKKESRLRIRYISDEGLEYVADNWGTINDTHTLLTALGYETRVYDNGNGLRIEGDMLSISLNYGQAADLYHAIKAAHDADMYRRGRGIWAPNETIITEVRNKSITSKKKKKTK